MYNCIYILTIILTSYLLSSFKIVYGSYIIIPQRNPDPS
jgi:hypothetical protein